MLAGSSIFLAWHDARGAWQSPVCAIGTVLLLEEQLQPLRRHRYGPQGRRGGVRGAFNASIRRRAGVRHYLRATPTTTVVAAAVAVAPAVLATPTAAVAAVTAAVLVTPTAVIVATACAGIWPDPIEDRTVRNHAGAAPTAAVITAAAAAVPTAVVVAAPIAAVVTVGVTCAGVRPDQVQDGRTRGAAPLQGTPGFGPPS